VALALAAERGYDGTTIALVSERSGLPASSIYWHFANKDALLEAAMEHGALGWRTSLVALEEGERKPFPDAVRDRLAAGARATLRRPEYARFGTKLVLESRPEETAPRRVYREIHADVQVSLRAWWRAVLPADVQDPALARRLSDLHLAFLEGLYLDPPDDDEVEVLAELVARSLVDLVARWRGQRGPGGRGGAA